MVSKIYLNYLFNKVPLYCLIRFSDSFYRRGRLNCSTRKIAIFLCSASGVPCNKVYYVLSSTIVQYYRESLL